MDIGGPQAGRPARRTRASISSKATSRSTASGSSTTSRSATSVLPLVAIANPGAVRHASRCACSSSTSRRTCRSCAVRASTGSASSSRRRPRSTACARTRCSTRRLEPLVYGPINKQRWIYACSKQLMDRVIYAYGMRDGPRLHAVPAVQLDRPDLDNVDEPKEGSSRVITQFLWQHRARRADQARRRRRAEALVHLHRRRHRRAAEDHREHGRRRATRRIFNIGNPDNDVLGRRARPAHRAHRRGVSTAARATPRPRRSSGRDGSSSTTASVIRTSRTACRRSRPRGATSAGRPGRISTPRSARRSPTT